MITPRKGYAHLDRLAAWQAGEKPAPVTIEWDLTNRCDRACDGCHFAHTHSRGPLARRRLVDTGDVADTAMVLRALGEAAQAGVRGIVWTGGGEPTLHPDIARFVRRACDEGLAQGLYTHGGRIGAELGALLRATLAWVVVSLDRADAVSYQAYKGGGFDAACAGVRALAGGAAEVGVSFLLDATCYRDAWRMLALARELGATYTTFRPLILADPRAPAVAAPQPWIADALPVLADLAREPDVVCDLARFRQYAAWERSYPVCHGVKLTTTITPDGRVWLCPNRRGMTELGNLHRESFAAIWQRHPGQWSDFAQCRVMCRLHQVNEALAPLFAHYAHEAFV